MNHQFSVNLTDDQEAIIALSTPQGSGAIALVRLSGDNVFDVVNAFSRVSSSKKILDLTTHTIHHGFIINNEDNSLQPVDEVLFFLMRGPKTFTGQDTIEISCHNNPLIIEKIIQLACKSGARLAKHGEFCKRAFLNGKIKLSQAEAINELINAQNELSLKKSMEQITGTLSGFLANLENDFVNLLGLTEATFEFIDEELADINLNQLIKERCLHLTEKLNKLSVDFSHQQQIKNGIKIALIGHVNAGKSTLFNVLLNQNRAIVSSIEGTTRDSIEASIHKDGVFWTFIDTAGLRETVDLIEQQGIQRSILESDKSDIILLVVDASQKMDNQSIGEYQKVLDKHAKKTIFVLNKIDKKMEDVFCFLRHSFAHNCVVEVSAEQGIGVEKLVSVIHQKVKNMFEGYNSCFLLNQRQARLVNEIGLKLDFIVKDHLIALEYELIAYKIKEILELMSELTGRDIGERALDVVFKNFCVGK
jgi:tRNA modification GTPase